MELTGKEKNRFHIFVMDLSDVSILLEKIIKLHCYYVLLLTF